MSAPLFKPFRALGYITEDVPFAVQRRGKETYVTVSVGRTWQIYNTAKLTLVMIGPQLPHTVNALACKGDLTFAATGAIIHEAKRSYMTGKYASHSGRILQLLVLADQLLSLGRNSKLLVWKIGDYQQPQTIIDFGPDFKPTCMIHPDTYINKVVVGGQDGSLQLWNFVTGQLVHTFKGWGSPVRCIAASPALDVVGVGLSDGRAVLHNLRYDEELLVLHNAAAAGTAAGRLLSGSAAAAAAASSNVAVSCLAFRTGNGLPLLAAGGTAGIIAFWDLEQRCLHHVLRDAHDKPLLSLHFFAGESLLMSSAADNSIKQWVLDGQGSVPRLLKFRAGHSAPPAVVRHYAEGLRLLSAGVDCAFRMFSTIQDQQSRELSQKHVGVRAKKARATQEEIKLTRVVQLASSEVRERDWANVITCHANDPAAYTWRLANFTLGEHVLLPPPDPSQQQQQQRRMAAATAVAISCCGNFGLVGNDAGHVHRYNLQSGLHRGAYCRRQGEDTLLPAHGGTVAGLGSDSCNKVMVTVGADAMLRTWDFRRQQLTAELPLGSAATHVALHTGSDLAAVACADKMIRIVDIKACRVVRRFSGHSDRITDLVISGDCRWLLSAGMDCTLRVWDVPASQCLQVMHMGTPVTSLSLSSTQDLLATAHVNKRGVFLWSNQLMYGDPASVATYTDKPVPVHLPTIAASSSERRQQQQQQHSDQRDAVQVAGSTSKAAGRHRTQQQQDTDSNSDSESSGSDSSDDEAPAAAGAGAESQDLTDHLQSGHEVRLLVDGGAISDVSTSDFYDTDSDSDDSVSDISNDIDTDMEAAAAGECSSGSGTDSVGVEAKANGRPDKHGRKRDRQKRSREAAGASAAAAYRQTDLTGAPAPLGPGMTTLSLLPRSQWENLLHLDTIKARSKPLQPPKKPEAAPFFLPTLPGLSGQPNFAADGTANGVDGVTDGDDAVMRPEQGASNSRSRVLRSSTGVASAAAAPSQFVALLRNSKASNDFTSFVGHLRSLSPASLDLELRAMVVLEGAVTNDQQLEDIGLLLECLEGELDAARNFDMVQALLARILVVHGNTLTHHQSLLTCAERLQRKLRGTWLKLDDLLQNLRCMVDFVSNAQA